MRFESRFGGTADGKDRSPERWQLPLEGELVKGKLVGSLWIFFVGGKGSDQMGICYFVVPSEEEQFCIFCALTRVLELSQEVSVFSNADQS